MRTNETNEDQADNHEEEATRRPREGDMEMYKRREKKYVSAKMIKNKIYAVFP